MDQETWVEVAWGDIKVRDTLQWQGTDGEWRIRYRGVVVGLNIEGPNVIRVEIGGSHAHWNSDFKYRKLVVVEEKDETPDLEAQIDAVFAEIKAMLLERVKTKAKRAPIEGGCEYCDSVVPEFCGSCPFCGKR